MIEAKYEHFQPETRVILGHVELHKVCNRRRGGGSETVYIVAYESRENPADTAEFHSEQFKERVDALTRFNKILSEFNSQLG